MKMKQARSLKRPRAEAPNPVVLDDFETEAKREVAASAGLTGSSVESGSRLELKHQVRGGVVFEIGSKFTGSVRAGPPPSRCTPWLQSCPTIATCSSSKT
ncbi:hypothetical protein B0H15DRAFT_419711 [Mycena belliarum]|uniref:Uncharacterized protein n=1 Tax=Mycena belliarum TaxID=1033014 RepID=A0AAD6TY82_9AGAR|nr:hypothetical protein B0H15DRAFT_419711 [Mycena belliae]